MTITDAPHNKSTLKLLKRLINSYIASYMGPLFVALFFMILEAAMTAAIARLIQPILDDVLGGQETHMIVPIGLLVLLTFVVRGISTYVQALIMMRVGQSIVADVQRDLFSKFLILDLTFFHDNPSGQLISRVVNDVNVMRIAMADSLSGIGKSFFTLVFLIAIMFYQDWKLSLIAFTIFPFVSLFVMYIGKRLRKVSRNIQNELANLSDRLSQIFQGIRQVQAYGMQEYEIARAGIAIDRVKNLNIKAVRIGEMSTPVNEILIGFVFLGIIVYGGFEAAEGRMTAGQLASFLAAFTLAYEPMKKLSRLNNTVQMGLGAAERIFDMLDLQTRIQDSGGAMPLRAGRNPQIEFRNVGFSYKGTDVRAIKDVSFAAEPGKITALVGPSGGGKTTIMNLIPRFYDPAMGDIVINGQSLRDVTLESLRSHIALVSQDITIFDDTIEANIAYGKIGADPEAIIDAAKAAEAHDFIQGFPEGYQTMVGEDGVKLSGGQRQRIAIARAILRDAPILLLDEATSALDNESERAVRAALENLEKGRTTIVIAHRLSTVQNADQIIVLDKGQIVERGTHQSLIERGGLYARMYELGLQE